MKWNEKDGVRFCVINASLTEPVELWRSKAVLESWKAHFQSTFFLRKVRSYVM